MKSAGTAIISGILVIASFGCAVCDTSLDDDYVSFGGPFERTDQYSRVGSSFSPSSPVVGTIGEIAESDPFVDERPLDPEAGTTPDESQETPRDENFDSDGPVTPDQIPPFDDGDDFENLLEQIPGTESGFPGDVRAIPIDPSLEEPGVQLASAIEPLPTGTTGNFSGVLQLPALHQPMLHQPPLTSIDMVLPPVPATISTTE
ncbi:MAG: hypothetical protein KDB27_28995 [Planctomycetales bacterium]|nr:hypothetical protein [Planctomycetales bacterium]